MAARGLRIAEQRTIETTYSGNARSLMSTVYRCLFFVATKLPVGKNDAAEDNGAQEKA